MATQGNQDFMVDVDGRRVGPNYKWVVVGMLWCITFFNYADRYALNTNLPLISKEMHLEKMWAGMLGAAFGLSYGLSAVFAGFIVDRVRRRIAVLFGLCAWSVICAATYTANTFWALFAFLALEGLGEAFYFPAAMSMVSDYHGQRTRSRAMSINQTSVYIGQVGGAFFAALLASHYGWRSAFLVFGLLGMVLAVVLWKFLREPKRGAADLIDRGICDAPEPAPKKVVPVAPGAFLNATAIAGLILLLPGIIRYFNPVAPEGTSGPIYVLRAFGPYALTLIGLVLLALRKIRKDGEFLAFFKIFFTTPTAVLLLLAFFCANSVAAILMVWMTTFIFETVYGGQDVLLLTSAALLATMPLNLASMFGSPTGGLLADKLRAKTRRGRVAVQMAALFCAMPFVFICGHASTAAWIIVALVGWGVFKGIYDANIFASVYDVIRPDMRGMTAGVMNLFAWAGGGAIAPIVAGAIADKKGLGYAISSASLGYIIAGSLLFVAAMFFVKRDSERMQASLVQEAK